MKKQKVQILNLAEMKESDLLKLIEDNDMDIHELFSVLESLLEMFSCSLKFSSIVFRYGHEHHPDFVPNFLQHAVTNHGINPQRLVDILQSGPNTGTMH